MDEPNFHDPTRQSQQLDSAHDTQWSPPLTVPGKGGRQVPVRTAIRALKFSSFIALFMGVYSFSLWPSNEATERPEVAVIGPLSTLLMTYQTFHIARLLSRHGIPTSKLYRVIAVIGVVLAVLCALFGLSYISNNFA